MTDLALKATLDYSSVSQGFDAIISKSGQVSSGLSSAFSKGTGDWKKVGATMGQDLIGGVSGQFGMFGGVANSALSALTPLTLGVAALGAGFVVAGAKSVQAASSWESSMAGVAKTTGLAGEDLEKLSSDLLELSTNSPIAASELASIAEAGGSLGIAKEELAGFTEVAAQMGVGFGMAADEAATAGAKILNSFGQEMDTSNLEKLGSVVNVMGDSFAATEPQVLDFLNRASFLNTTMGQNIQQVSALGTTLISAGMSSETAATGLKSFLNMATSTTSRTGGMDNWAKLMGTSVDELKEKLGTDLNSTLIETATKIAAIEDPVERFQTAVKLAGTEGAPALLKLAGQQENYRKALGLTNEEWEKANSLQKTFDAQSGTLNSQWTMFTNTLNTAAVELGTVLLPYATELVSTLNDMTKAAIAFSEYIGSGVSSAADTIGGWIDSADDFLNNKLGFLDTTTTKEDGVETAREFKEAAQAEMGDDPLGLNDPAVQQAAKDAGIDLGELTGENAGKTAAENFDDAFWSNIEQLQSQGIQSGKATKLGERIAEYYSAGGTGALVTGTHGRNDKSSNEFAREFEYMGEQFSLGVTSYSGSAVGDWYDYVLKAGDTILAEKNSQSGHIDPLEAFELATGLPAPEEGTSAYYSLMGDEVAAKKAELQEELNSDKFVPEFDYDVDKVTSLAGKDSNILKSMLEIYQAKGEYGTEAEKAASDAAGVFGEALADVDWARLEGVESAAAQVKNMWGNMFSGGEGGQTQGEVIDESIVAYKEKLMAGITDLKAFTESKASEFSGIVSDAFSDSFISEDERTLISALEPQLELLKAEAPDEFEAAGLDSWLAFVEEVKGGASASELYEDYKKLGTDAGNGYQSGLFGALNSTESKTTLSDIVTNYDKHKDAIASLPAWIESEYQPALKSEMESMNSMWDTGLTDQRKIVEEDLGLLQDTYENHSDWFEDWQADLISRFDSGDLSIGEFLDTWSDYASQAEESSTAAIDSIKQSNALFYGEFLDDTAQWTDYVNEYGGYIGPTALYEEYKEAVNAEIEKAQDVNAEFEITTVGSISVTAETDLADQELSAFEQAVVDANPELKITALTQSAYDEVNELLTYIIQSNPLIHIRVAAYADEIDAAISSALRSLSSD